MRRRRIVHAAFYRVASGAALAALGVFGMAAIGCAAQPQQPPVVVSQQTLKIKQSGEGILHLTARAPGCDWGKKGAESAVVTVTLDHTVRREVVLFDGDKAHTYDLLLGAVTAGTHHLKIAFRPDLSPVDTHTAIVDRVKMDVIVPDDARYGAISHLPLLYGRDDNAMSDTPLILTYESRNLGAGRRRFLYTVIFSNEDGGTGNDLGSLVARWGRSTDIELIYDVTVGANGKAESAVIQAAGHRILPFQGSYEGTHPLLRTSTTNNMVADTGKSRFLFGFAPLRETFPAWEPREALMDDAPWSHRLAASEMQREGKWESVPDPNTIAASDIRNYLQVTYEARVSGGAKLAVQVRLKDGSVYLSSHGRESDAIGRSGQLRTTVELPPGIKGKDIAGIGFVRADSSAADASVAALQAFLLGRDFRPQTPLIRWFGPPLKVPPGAPIVIPGL